MNVTWAPTCPVCTIERISWTFGHRDRRPKANTHPHHVSGSFPQYFYAPRVCTILQHTSLLPPSPAPFTPSYYDGANGNSWLALETERQGECVLKVLGEQEPVPHRLTELLHWTTTCNPLPCRPPFASRPIQQCIYRTVLIGYQQDHTE